jgi:type II secretory pathway component GspD/PulD (secretin)
VVAAAAAAGGCKADAAARQASASASLFDPSIPDLIHQRAGGPRAAAPEPKLIDAGDKATLVYPARHARPEVLKDAVSGLLNPDGTIQDSAALNSLVIQDEKKVVANILAVLQSIDNPIPQLLVEARVVEVTLDDDLEYEIQHTLTIPNSPGAFFQNSDITLKVPGSSPTVNQGAELHIRPWASADIRLDNFIRLLQTKGKANILSSPNVIVTPGTEASIITGQEVPIQSTTTVAGSLSTSTTFKRVGIKLRVALQQITSDTARLDVNPEVSTVTGFTQVSQGVSNPVISLRNVSSTVSLKDGEILTVGGLLQDERQVNTRGIPGLQDIPNAGFLFQSKRDIGKKTQLIFFLRVHILSEGEPNGINVHKPGASLEQIGQDAKLLNPNELERPTLKEVTEPKPKADGEPVPPAGATPTPRQP